MGKLVVCANHPSNEFFKQFSNCLTYDNSQGFVKIIHRALTDEPAPMTDAQIYELSWEAANERFVRASGLEEAHSKRLSKIPSKNFMSVSLSMKRRVEDASAFVHHVASGFEVSRRAFGAIPGSLQPDEQQCKELGLPFHGGKRGS